MKHPENFDVSSAISIISFDEHLVNTVYITAQHSYVWWIPNSVSKGLPLNWNYIDELVQMAWPKLIELGFNHGLESCELWLRLRTLKYKCTLFGLVMARKLVPSAFFLPHQKSFVCRRVNSCNGFSNQSARKHLQWKCCHRWCQIQGATWFDIFSRERHPDSSGNGQIHLHT